MFTYLEHGDHFGGINDQRNFDSISNAFLLLMQALTGDGGSSMMADSMKDETSGRCSIVEGNCGSWLALPYFISFQVIGSFIFLNLVVAVILENFAALYFTSPDLVSSSDLEVFSEAWQQFDPVSNSNASPQKLAPPCVAKARPNLCSRSRSPHSRPRRECTSSALLTFVSSNPNAH